MMGNHQAGENAPRRGSHGRQRVAAQLAYTVAQMIERWATVTKITRYASQEVAAVRTAIFGASGETRRPKYLRIKRRRRSSEAA